jgi:hypothetical protein
MSKEKRGRGHPTPAARTKQTKQPERVETSHFGQKVSTPFTAFRRDWEFSDGRQGGGLTLSVG